MLGKFAFVHVGMAACGCELWLVCWRDWAFVCDRTGRVAVALVAVARPVLIPGHAR